MGITMILIEYLSVVISLTFCCDGLVLGNTMPPYTALSMSSYHLLEDLFIKERQTLTQYVVNLEQKFIARNQVLERKLNQTAEEIANITQTLASEKSNRVQLQKDYDKLLVDFYDLTVEHFALKAKNQELIVNNTNQENKIANLEEILHNLTDSVDKINSSEFSTVQTEITALKQRAGQQVAFTADYPHDGPSTGTIRFTNVITNIGNNYDSTTGQFTCTVPGVYLFSLDIYKTASVPVASCFIRHNQANVVEAFSSPPGLGGYFEASSSVVLHLKQGETVDLHGCTVASTMEWLTTFSGVLVSAD